MNDSNLSSQERKQKNHTHKPRSGAASCDNTSLLPVVPINVFLHFSVFLFMALSVHMDGCYVNWLAVTLVTVMNLDLASLKE